MMKAFKLMMSVAVLAVAASSASANSIAVKGWYAEATGIEDPAMLYGGTASLSLTENLWLSAMFLTGTYDGKNDKGLPIIDVDTTDAELVLGYSFTYLDLGAGARVTQWKWQDTDDDFWIFGPMVYAATGTPFGDTPFGWYLGASWMFKDFGDAYDRDWDTTYEHYNIEAGISMDFNPVTATIGYRYKAYTDSNVDLDFRGPVASLGFGF